MASGGQDPRDYEKMRQIKEQKAEKLAEDQDESMKQEVALYKRSKKSKPGRGVNPSLNVNYNQTNVVMCGPISNIQIGCNNTIYSRPMTRSQQPTKIPRLSERQKEMYNTMKDCKDEVNQEMMVYLSKGWSRSWKRWARYLSIRDEGMTNICDSFTEPREAAYQMIKYWKQKTRDPSVGNFVTLLTIKGEFESIIPLFKDGTFKAH